MKMHEKEIKLDEKVNLELEGRFTEQNSDELTNKFR